MGIAKLFFCAVGVFSRMQYIVLVTAPNYKYGQNLEKPPDNIGKIKSNDKSFLTASGRKKHLE
jgi:hypothetical protein